jgi:hypothetical protein
MLQSSNKDQYRATVDVNQLIYNGGLNANAKSKKRKPKRSSNKPKSTYTKTRINQLYFSTFLLQERYGILISKQEQLDSKIKEVKLEIYAILPASEKVLEAEN